MKKVSDFLVNHCYVIFGVFLAITAICAVLATQVNINKDVYSYMPADSETALGLKVMDDEFDYSSTSEYEIMLTDVPAEEKMAIKEHIESIEGVKSVGYDESDNYNRDRYTRYKITIDAPADSDTADRVYNTVYNEYHHKYEMTENGRVYNYNGKVMPTLVTTLAVTFAMVILFIMSKSWVEPWLYLFAILLAVVVNKGTNIIFPNVSHITDAIAAILQMALSMDYAIMLSTRYRQEKAKDDHPDKKTAMRRAMRYSFGAISSSSITTVVGLLVLILMSFTIGRDMGLVLSKGVVLSLVSIFTSLPALLLLFDKAITKTEKKTLNLKMDWFGRRSFELRKIALPIFLFILVGSFLLKGSTVINFTTEKNNRIGDVFSEINQIALVYKAEMDDVVTKVCQDFDARDDTKRVLCYGNTINEPEKYNELFPKVNELSDEEVEAEDYLIKAIYYHYFRSVETHAIALDDLVAFLQNEVFTDSEFADEISQDTRDKVNRFAYFVDQKKVKQPRVKQEIAKILGVDSKKLDELYVLYLSEQNPSAKLTLNQFANFVASDILSNPSYAKMVTASQRNDLAKLRTFSNPSITNSPKTVAELAKLFGINQRALEQLLVYYNFKNTTEPTQAISMEELVNFALTNQNVLDELRLTKTQADQIKTGLTDAKQTLLGLTEKSDELLDDIVAQLSPELQSELAPHMEEIRSKLHQQISVAQNALTRKYSYSEIAGAANKVNGALDTSINWLDNLETNYPEIFENLDDETREKVLNYAGQISGITSQAKQNLDLNNKLEKLKDIYKLYQAENTASTTKVSPRELVNFLLAHKNDEKLKDALSSETISQLSLAQFIMNNQSKKFSANELAQTFNLDNQKVKLVFALYGYRRINKNPKLSLRTLITFIDEKVLPNDEYASRLSQSEQTQLRTIAKLMRAAANGVPYNYGSLYRAILPLADNVDKNQIFLAYLLHGSRHDYDESWTLTLETFVNFLYGKVLPDSRFAERIDVDTRAKIEDGYDMVKEAKDLLVGPKHYRALVETELPAESTSTFALIGDLKNAMGPNNKTDYYVMGDSAMAYELTQTFGNEMNFITVVTMLAIFAVVLCTFKSFFVSLLLVLVIQCAVYIVMAYLSLTGSSIFFIALIVVQSILMGATIDYAILFTSYYVEYRSYFKLSIKDALISTYNRSINAILTSASILIIVTALVGNMATAIAATICASISLGTFCATLIILLLLPALLATLDRFIVKPDKPKVSSASKGPKKILDGLKSLL